MIVSALRLPNGASERVWNTNSGRAEFFVFDGVEEDEVYKKADIVRLTTLRSHDQYSTTIYDMDDRYRGVFGLRDVLFIGRGDMLRLEIRSGQRVDVRSAQAGRPEAQCSFNVVEHTIYLLEASGFPQMQSIALLSYFGT